MPAIYLLSLTIGHNKTRILCNTSSVADILYKTSARTTNDRIFISRYIFFSVTYCLRLSRDRLLWYRDSFSRFDVHCIMHLLPDTTALESDFILFYYYYYYVFFFFF